MEQRTKRQDQDDDPKHPVRKGNQHQPNRPQMLPQERNQHKVRREQRNRHGARNAPEFLLRRRRELKVPRRAVDRAEHDAADQDANVHDRDALLERPDADVVPVDALGVGVAVAFSLDVAEPGLEGRAEVPREAHPDGLVDVLGLVQPEGVGEEGAHAEAERGDFELRGWQAVCLADGELDDEPNDLAHGEEFHENVFLALVSDLVFCDAGEVGDEATLGEEAELGGL